MAIRIIEKKTKTKAKEYFDNGALLLLLISKTNKTKVQKNDDPPN